MRITSLVDFLLLVLLSNARIFQLQGYKNHMRLIIDTTLSDIDCVTQRGKISSGKLDDIKPAMMLCNINVMLTRRIKQGRTETLTTGTSNPLKSYFAPKLKKPTRR